MGIVVMGAVFVDIKGYPTQQYIPSGRNMGYVEQVHGGVSRNIAEDIANLDLHPCFISLVDQTAAGDEVIRKLTRSGADTRFMRHTQDGMGTWLAIFDNDGDVVAAISKRPELEPILDILNESGDEIFSECDSILVEIDMSPEVVQKTFEYAKKYGKKVFAPVSNMTIASQRRDLIKETDCFVCNLQEAGIFFSEDFEGFEPVKMQEVLFRKVQEAHIQRMVVTMGGQGSVYASMDGESGYCPALKVPVKDTTGAGDAFFAGVAVGLTYGKTLAQSCSIGTRLAASVISSVENVCPRFLPGEFGIGN